MTLSGPLHHPYLDALDAAGGSDGIAIGTAVCATCGSAVAEVFRSDGHVLWKAEIPLPDLDRQLRDPGKDGRRRIYAFADNRVLLDWPIDERFGPAPLPAAHCLDHGPLEVDEHAVMAWLKAGHKRKRIPLAVSH